MGTIRAVIFDLGRVLVNIDPAKGLIRHLVAIDPHHTLDEIMTTLTRHDLFRKYSSGELTPQEFYHEACRALGLELPYEEFAALWCSIFFPMDGIAELFAEVAAVLPVGLLSDTDPLHWNFLRENYPFLQRIERPTLSFETGFLKPDPRAYRAAVFAAGVSAPSCLFIDDLAQNVDGARREGLQAVQFTAVGALRAALAEWGILTCRHECGNGPKAFPSSSR